MNLAVLPGSAYTTIDHDERAQDIFVDTCEDFLCNNDRTDQKDLNYVKHCKENDPPRARPVSAQSDSLDSLEVACDCLQVFVPRWPISKRSRGKALSSTDLLLENPMRWVITES